MGHHDDRCPISINPSPFPVSIRPLFGINPSPFGINPSPFTDINTFISNTYVGGNTLNTERKQKHARQPSGLVPRPPPRLRRPKWPTATRGLDKSRARRDRGASRLRASHQTWPLKYAATRHASPTVRVPERLRRSSSGMMGILARAGAVYRLLLKIR